MNKLYIFLLKNNVENH